MQRSVIAIAAAATLFACIQVSAEAQTFAKPPPRLNPNVSDTIRVPAGIDSGSPTTSDSLPLGTPVPPVGSVDRIDQGTRSAAARAAARPASRTPLLSSATSTQAASDRKAAECATGSEASFRLAMSACSNLANRADRANCAARASQDRRDAAIAQPAPQPVALPGSGFTGSSAGAQTSANATASTAPSRGPSQVGCV